MEKQSGEKRGNRENGDTEAKIKEEAEIAQTENKEGNEF